MQNDELRILFLGDIVGNPGRKAAIKFVQAHRKQVDCIIANCENASGGKGITIANAQELMDAGIDGMTSGNHIWHKKDIATLLSSSHQIIRPLNYPPGTPGEGYTVLNLQNNIKVGLINLLGRIYMETVDCPFRCLEEPLEKLNAVTPILLVDFHAEASSEKRAMGFFLDGKVSAVLGTHTHVQTNDFQLLPKGTAYITDAGMTGPHHSVIGVKKEIIVQKFVTQIPEHFDVSKESIQRVDYVEIILNRQTGKAISIKGCHELIDE